MKNKYEESTLIPQSHLTEVLEEDAKMDSQKINSAGGKCAPIRTDKDKPEWFFVPLVFGFVLGVCCFFILLNFIRSVKCEKPLVERDEVKVTMRHTIQPAFNIGNFFLGSHSQVSNVEVTGAARLYRAASVWTAGLGDLVAKHLVADDLTTCAV